MLSINKKEEVSVEDNHLNKIIENIRAIGIDMINEAKSGHPGIVLGAAPIIATLYNNHIKVDQSNDKWLNRDRFIMSAGHGSALLYSTLFMAGFDIPYEELRRFHRPQRFTRVPGRRKLIEKHDGVCAKWELNTAKQGTAW